MTLLFTVFEEGHPAKRHYSFWYDSDRECVVSGQERFESANVAINQLRPRFNGPLSVTFAPDVSLLLARLEGMHEALKFASRLYDSAQGKAPFDVDVRATMNELYDEVLQSTVGCAVFQPSDAWIDSAKSLHSEAIRSAFEVGFLDGILAGGGK